jgi:Uma2 family endonuclease
MSATTARKRPTYADIEALPEHLTGEILAGELVVSPRPAPRHTRAGTMLAHAIGGPFDAGDDGPGGWWIMAEPELHLGVDPDYPVVIPDLAGWRVERLPVLPDTAAWMVAPDWACEVLSPSTERWDRAAKLPFYARAAIAHVWLVAPALQTVEVFRLDGPTYRLLDVVRGEGPVRVEPFDAVELRLGLLWGRPAGSP